MVNPWVVDKSSTNWNTKFKSFQIHDPHETTFLKKKPAGYAPLPLDTSKVELSDDILKLSELLAENSHDVWARERIAQGWKWGAAHDDTAKTHPALIPYKDLPESEKRLDRNAALETIKTVLALGLTKTDEKVSTISDTSVGGIDPVDKARKIISQLKKPKLTVAELRRLWEERVPLIWMASVDLYRRAVDSALKLGEAFTAFDMADEGLTTFKGDLRLIQLQALALARTGATKRANEILEQLRSSGHGDEETLGILARTHKDFWQISTDPAEKERHLKLSFELYADAYQRNRGYYSGINAAAMGLIYGEQEKAHQWAEEVANMCLMCQLALPKDSDEHYWIEATLAESFLVRGQLGQAEELYAHASTFGGQSWVVLNRTRDQARLLLEHSGQPRNRLDHCFKLPNIVVCAGHMFDKVDRAKPRFPFRAEEMVRQEIKKRLADMEAQVGFCSLACGTDMLFAEAILERGGEVNIVLPFNKEDFRLASVDVVPDVDLGARFEKILENAATVTVLTETGRATEAAAYDYCNQVLIGLSLLKAQFLGIDVKPFAVWNGAPGDGRGGTEGFVNFWRQRQFHVELIELDKFLEEEINRPTEFVLGGATEDMGQTEFFVRSAHEVAAQEIKAMLFADIKGYTKLSEKHIPPFVHHFLGKVATLMDAMKRPPIHRNTWGDAIHCVFDDVADAGIFALNLRDLVCGTDWSGKGLPPDLNIRIALHAGPAYPCFDPVVKKLTFLGAHVNRTARIEPIAEEGQIYASQPFAALAAANGAKDFVCDYVGTKQLAKKFGSIPVFLVRRAS